ncbi:MAG TPA: nucleotidyltransferase family protein [Pseudomonadales bacterium]|nr:nucleotidyltransferase family protein [Pseudomonadales bacterium]
MILSAGLGTRLRPLTDRVPKPLLEVAGRPLIEHHLARLAGLGVARVVINLHHLGDRIRAHLGDGERFGVEIRYAPEPRLLETAGGIHAALPLLGDAPFLVMNGDVFCDYDPRPLLGGPGEALCHLVMVPSPAWRTHGDFDLAEPLPRAGERRALVDGGRRRFTYAGIGVYAPALFATMAPGPLPLRPLLDAAIAGGRATGELHEGVWDDIGTAERLQAARQRFGS